MAPGAATIAPLDVVNQKAASALLLKLGCQVGVAADGSEALRRWINLP
jgi:CheY-like chemotaxis protein